MSISKSRLTIGNLAVSLVFCSITILAAQEPPDEQSAWSPPILTEKLTGDLPEMRKQKAVRVLVPFSKTGFFLVKGQPRGIHAEEMQQYEKFLNEGIKKDALKTHVVFVLVPFVQVIPALVQGQGDIGVALLTITPERKKRVAFADPSLKNVDEVVVTAKGVEGLDTLEDLSGRSVYVLRASSYAEHLRALNARLVSEGRAPVDVIEADRNLVTEDILELVNAGVVDLAVADHYIAELWSKVLPNITVRADLRVQTGGQIAWAVRKDNPELLRSLNTFVRTVKKGTLLGNILFKRYFQNTRWIKNPLVQKERDKLDEFILLFKKYGNQYGFDYLAIGAQAYQESGLDHSVRSPAGAVGIMQLLPSTADDPNVNIPHIEILENNIHAGVKYLAFLRNTYFKDPELSMEDRFAFSWAAYNAGPAKVRKMRARARAMGLDPNKWFFHVEYAAQELVGAETVRYVANIYKYYIAYSLVREILEKRAAELEALSGHVKE